MSTKKTIESKCFPKVDFKKSVYYKPLIKVIYLELEHGLTTASTPQSKFKKEEEIEEYWRLEETQSHDINIDWL